MHALDTYQDWLDSMKGVSAEMQDKGRKTTGELYIYARMAELVYFSGSEAEDTRQANCMEIQAQGSAQKEDWPKAWRIVGHNTAAKETIMETDRDHVAIWQNEDLDCAIAFSGSNEGKSSDFALFIFQSSVEYCGLNIAEGIAHELKFILKRLGYYIMDTLKRCNPGITVIGHSLGGSLAEAFAACVNRAYDDPPATAEGREQQSALQFSPMSRNYVIEQYRYGGDLFCTGHGKAASKGPIYRDSD